MSTTGQRDDQHRLPRGVDTSAEEMGEENQAQEKEALLARPSSRQKFASDHDIVLLKAMNTVHKSFGLKKPGTAMRTRFTNLVNQLLVALMNDWEDKEAQRKEEQTAKQRGIERSGELSIVSRWEKSLLKKQ
ncbi:hypothetical protein F443_23153 [Phytophthora nicotianae P1569]|uniref:Uncharacterized protein n=1 Tax=Phytophthora nicotianae P1569 TaxID=1317065 RepID=V9DTR7_PHYNI|nr:hypothetical protein F443_23153 [Phytophthora nicotianae P1569]